MRTLKNIELSPCFFSLVVGRRAFLNFCPKFRTVALLGLDGSKPNRSMAFIGMDAPALTTATVVDDAASDRWDSIQYTLESSQNLHE